VNEGLVAISGPGNPVRAFVSVTVCVPGTATCQTIDNIALDTGSTGLRIFNSLLNVPLPPQSLSAGAITEECALFGTSARSTGLWGTINTADVEISGETAKSVPIQLIGGTLNGICSNSPQVPTDIGFNGLLGVNPSPTDCSNMGCGEQYWSCSAGVCNPQNGYNAVVNPVYGFATDNNGILIQLPSVPDSGGSDVTGSLIFGIGTQSNNALGNAQVLTLNSNMQVTSILNVSSGAFLPAIFDTGTFTWDIDPSSVSAIPAMASMCGDYYCPQSAVPLTVTATGANNVSQAVSFQVENLSSLDIDATAFDDTARSTPGEFIFGLPFFFGKNVYFGYPTANGVSGVPNAYFVAW
jgi:hypothetical protein